MSLSPDITASDFATAAPLEFDVDVNVAGHGSKSTAILHCTHTQSYVLRIVRPSPVLVLVLAVAVGLTVPDLLTRSSTCALSYVQ
jgi:hypothetical protein